MTLHDLTVLSDKELNNLLLQFDNWSFDKDKNQFFKYYENSKIIFDVEDFSPFEKPFQAEIIKSMSKLDFSLIQNAKENWGLMVWQDKDKKYLLLESSSYLKSCLLLIIAVNSGLLNNNT